MKKINSEAAGFFVAAMGVLGTIAVVSAIIYGFIQGKSEPASLSFSLGVGLLFAAALLKWIDNKFFS